jgi:hypothetical protein
MTPRLDLGALAEALVLDALQRSEIALAADRQHVKPGARAARSPAPIGVIGKRSPPARPSAEAYRTAAAWRIEIVLDRRMIIHVVAAEIGEPRPPAFTPSRRRWSSPWLDASIEACVTPALASSASSVQRHRIGRRQRAVVVAPGRDNAGRADAGGGRPACSHIWRVNEATEVLPLVPVTATMISAARRRSAAASSASARRASSTRRTGMDSAANIGASARQWPRRRDWLRRRHRRRRRPSSPAGQKTGSPGWTWRESDVMPVTSKPSEYAAASAGRMPAKSFSFIRPFDRNGSPRPRITRRRPFQSASFMAEIRLHAKHEADRRMMLQRSALRSSPLLRPCRAFPASARR